MKKITLNPEQLSVVSFDVAPPEGSDGLFAITDAGTCGCYPSLRCSGPGCVQTYWDTCQTDNVYQC